MGENKVRQKIVVGDRISRWTVVSSSESDPKGRLRWACRCDCGTFRPVLDIALKYGGSKSCGCLRREVVTTHGHALTKRQTPEFRAWSHMRERCEVQKHPQYRHYGGRGITVCPEWASFEIFLSDMGERPSPLHSLDRVDNYKGYSPDNCKWSTRKEQTRNRRSSVIVVCDGKKILLIELAEKFGLTDRVVRDRVRRGWTPEKAVLTPVQKHRMPA